MLTLISMAVFALQAPLAEPENQIEQRVQTVRPGASIYWDGEGFIMREMSFVFLGDHFGQSDTASGGQLSPEELTAGGGVDADPFSGFVVVPVSGEGERGLEFQLKRSIGGDQANHGGSSFVLVEPVNGGERGFELRTNRAE